MSDIEWHTPIGTLTVVPAYRAVKNNKLLYDDRLLCLGSNRQQQSSIEVRLASDGTGPFQYLVGAYLL